MKFLHVFVAIVICYVLVDTASASSSPKAADQSLPLIEYYVMFHDTPKGEQIELKAETLNTVTIGLHNKNAYPIKLYYLRGHFANAFTGSLMANFTQRSYQTEVSPYTVHSFDYFLRPNAEHEDLTLQLTIEAPIQNDKGMFFFSYPVNTTVKVSPAPVVKQLDWSYVFMLGCVALGFGALSFLVFSLCAKKLKLNKKIGSSHTKHHHDTMEWVNPAHHTKKLK
eukprot:Nk52_evm5s1224 gene=Nk52_evmTU5s1224